MGWYLPDLAPGQSTSITVAFMFGYGPIDYNLPYDVDLSLTDDVAYCVYPNNDVTLTVSYAANQDINDVNLVVTLSPYLTFGSCTDGGIYNASNRTVTWNLGDRTIGDFNGLPIPDCNTYTINCLVNSNAPEGWYMRSTAELYAGQDLAEADTENSRVC